MTETPFNQIKKLLSRNISPNLIKKLPNKWEKIGDVLVLVLPTELEKYKETIGNTYSKELGCKTTLNDVGGISGIYREPNVEIIYGPNYTETIHKENGIRFKLDPQKIMFSSGNMDERIRMANVSNENEIVVDLFAGIGYFTLPIAVHGKPKKIFACEVNPVSYDYLCQNIVLNNVSDVVEPLKGNNRKVAPRDVADRVIMGYLENSHEFLPLAFDCLKNNKGIIHYHEVFPDKIVPKKPLEYIEKEVEKINLKADLLEYRHVKSYAPGISHYVFDLRIGEK